MWRALLSQLDAQGKLEWAQAFLDGSFVPAKKGGSSVGNTRIGKGSKVMVVADGHGLPIRLYVASARPSEHTLAAPTLATAQVPQQRGRPRTRPQDLVADKGYESQALRQQLRRRGIKPTILAIERRRRGPKRGRPLRIGASYR